MVQKHLTNSFDPPTPITQEVIQEKEEQGYKVIIADPEPTENASVEELKKMGMVGIYIEKKE